MGSFAAFWRIRLTNMLISPKNVLLIRCSLSKKFRIIQKLRFSVVFARWARKKNQPGQAAACPDFTETLYFFIAPGHARAAEPLRRQYHIDRA